MVDQYQAPVTLAEFSCARFDVQRSRDHLVSREEGAVSSQAQVDIARSDCRRRVIHLLHVVEEGFDPLFEGAVRTVLISFSHHLSLLVVRCRQCCVKSLADVKQVERVEIVET